MTRSAIIDPHPLGRNGVRQRVHGFARFAELACPAGDHICGHAGAPLEPPEEEQIELGVARVVRDDHEQIPVALRPGIAAGAAAEEPDLLGVVLRLDTREERADRT